MPVRVQAVFNRTGLSNANGSFDDKQMLISCPVCHEQQSLHDAIVHFAGGETRYDCKNGCQTLVVVMGIGPEAKPWPGRGYHVGDYIIRNIADLRVITRSDGAGIVLPARPHALAPESDRPE